MAHVSSAPEPRSGSRSGSGRRHEPGPGRAEAGGRKWDRPVLKVKITQVSKRTLSKSKRDEEETTQVSEKEPANKSETAASRPAGKQSAVTDSAGSCFHFKAVDEKKKAKLYVLRTISRMLEENQLIRQRLATANRAK